MQKIIHYDSTCKNYHFNYLGHVRLIATTKYIRFQYVLQIYNEDLCVVYQWPFTCTNDHNILLIEDGFRCELERFISATTASIVRSAPILMFWFERKKEKLTGKKKRSDVVSNSTHDKRYTHSAHSTPYHLC